MEGFKKTPKIACFKEGGQVGYKPRKTASDKKDVKQDKAIVKKAVGQHEAVKHKGEGKTELKLKSGGRCKKEAGTVKKYKKGGEVKKTPKKMNDGGLAATMAANPTAGQMPLSGAPMPAMSGPLGSMGTPPTGPVDRGGMGNMSGAQVTTDQDMMGRPRLPGSPFSNTGPLMGGMGNMSGAQVTTDQDMMGRQRPPGSPFSNTGPLMGGMRNMGQVGNLGFGNRGIRGGNRNAPMPRATHGNAARRPIAQLARDSGLGTVNGAPMFPGATPGSGPSMSGPLGSVGTPLAGNPTPMSGPSTGGEMTGRPSALPAGNPGFPSPVNPPVQQTMVGENPMSGQFAAMKRGGKAKGKKK